MTRCGGTAAGDTASVPRRVAAIAARATSLGERLDALSGGAVVSDPDAAASAAASAATHLARWRAVTAAGDDARFAERLRWSRLTPDAAASALAATNEAPNASDVPAWAALLAEALAEFDGALDADDVADALDAAAPLPFETLLLPFVRVASARAARRTRDAADAVASSAWRDLRRALLARLCAAADQALYSAFAASRLGYAGFVARARAGGMGVLLEAYPALARVLCTHCAQWVDACAELAERLNADAAEIAATFAPGKPLGALARVEAGVSDPHRGGRAVFLTTFANGLRLAYKPRSLGLERAFADLLAWLNDGRVSPPLRVLGVIDRGTHGWMEMAEPAPCASDDDVERFYVRGGMLLCLMYVLGGEDFHSGNVLACGDQPVLIDLEVLLCPTRAPDVIGGAPPRPVWRHVHGSVLRTGLLPELRLVGDAGGYVEGGLAALAGAADAASREWAHVNTDAMCVTERPATPPDRRNLPRLGGRVAGADPVAPTTRGFRLMYDALTAHRDALLAPNGPLDRFRGCAVRVVLRRTALYHTLLRRTLGPSALGSGVARSIELEVLARPSTASADGARLWPVLDDERRALEVMDVPAFWIASDDTTLVTSCGEVPGYATTSGLDGAAARLRAACGADRERQVHCVRIAYASHRARLTEGRLSAPPDAGAPLDAAEALAEACRIAALLERLAERGADGLTTWYALAPDAAAPGVRALGADVASGGGVGVFFAALAGRTNDARHRALATAGTLGTVTRPAGARCPWCGEPARGAPSVEDEAADALRELDYLCCGTFARVDLLLGAADATGRDDLRRRARVLARRAVERGRRRGTYGGALDSAFTPGLLGGIAGVGYTLLRLHDSRALPPLVS